MSRSFLPAPWLAWALGLLAAWPAAASGPFARTELKLPGRVVEARPADVDGDGLPEVLVFWRQGVPPKSRGRISVYRNRAGRIDPRPLQVASLPPTTAAYDVGDADGDGRADVLLLRPDGVWTLAGRADGRLSERPRPLVEAMTLAAIPNEDHVPPLDLLLSLDAGAGRGLLVPTVPIGPLALYRQGPDGRYRLDGLLRVPTRADLHTTAEDHRSARDYGAVFQLVLPRLVQADQDGDGRRDLLFFRRDELVVFRARPDGSFAERPDLQRGFAMLSEQERTRGGYQLRGTAADFDGDGRADVMFNKSSGGIANMTNELRLYLARADGTYPEQPDLQIHSRGYGALARAVDVDGDGRADLVRPHVQMGIMAMSQVLLTGRIDVDFQIHLARAGRPGPRPDFHLASSFGVDFRSNQELSGLYPLFGTDFDGDGRPDVVLGRAGGGSGEEPDRIEIRRGRPGGGFESGPAWSMSLTGTRAVKPVRWTKGQAPGLLLWFPSTRARQGDVWVLANSGRWK